MHGNQNRSRSNNYGFGHSRFGVDHLAREIAQKIKENGVEAVGWVGTVGFGIVTLGRMMGV
jgi:hypothetical protein